MVAAADTGPNRETWADWLPPDSGEPLDALTRDELIERLRRRGVDVTPRTLAHWESVGALPRAARRWRGGAPRALYPERAVDLVAQVRDLARIHDLTLQEVGQHLRAQAQAPPVGTVLPDGSTFGGVLFGGFPRAVARIMDFALAAFARRYHHATGRRAARVELHLVDEDGHTFVRVLDPARDATGE